MLPRLAVGYAVQVGCPQPTLLLTDPTAAIPAGSPSLARMRRNRCGWDQRIAAPCLPTTRKEGQYPSDRGGAGAGRAAKPPVADHKLKSRQADRAPHSDHE